MRELNLELLVSRPVYDVHGVKVGRIEEIIAEEIDGELVVTEYHVGHFGLAERFSMYQFTSWLLRRLGARSVSPKSARIPWDKMDLSDPENPRITCAKHEL
jgi:sporulation protein YlmC with PRC-barrel domain